MKPRHFTAFAILFLSPSLVYAGPKKVTLTVDSSPSGAMLYANDARTYMGQTPFKLEYRLNGSNDCQVQQGMALRWASGATEAVSTMTICPTKGKQQHFMVTRPAEAPNAALDWQIAYDIAAQREAQSWTTAAIILGLSANFATNYAAAYRPVYYVPPVSCLTIPGSLYTQTWCR